MFEVERIEDWQGQEVLDRDGEKIGKLEEVFTDVGTGEPAIGSVKTGLFGRKLSLVPLEGASLTRDHLRIAFSKDQVKDAPQADGGSQLNAEAEEALGVHYGLPARDSQGEPRTVRFETATAQTARSTEADALRIKAEELETQAAKHQGTVEKEEQTAAKHHEAGAAAGQEQSAKLSEAERLREEAARLEGG